MAAILSPAVTPPHPDLPPARGENERKRSPTLPIAARGEGKMKDASRECFVIARATTWREAIQSESAALDCFVAFAPRNDEIKPPPLRGERGKREGTMALILVFI